MSLDCRIYLQRLKQPSVYLKTIKGPLNENGTDCNMGLNSSCTEFIMHYSFEFMHSCTDC